MADDVEAALAKEIAHLNAVTSQLSHKVGAAHGFPPGGLRHLLSGVPFLPSPPFCHCSFLYPQFPCPPPSSPRPTQLGAVDKEISALDLAAITLEDNIRDKVTALSVDEQMVLLDGRINLSTAPPSSVGTVSSTEQYAASLHCWLPRDTSLYCLQHSSVGCG